MDLRTQRARDNLRFRSDVLQNVRKFLVDKYQFVETDTPSLVTPLGIMSSLRVDSGDGSKQFELIRQPSIHMLYLMIGQLDRCFNISKVYLEAGEEGQRERSCLQLGMSFVDADNAMLLVERLLQATLPHAADRFARLTGQEALRTYGSLHPDLTYDLKLYDVTEAMTDKMGDNYGAYAIIYPRSIGKFSNNMKTLLISLKARYTAVNISLDVARDVSGQVESSVRTSIKLDQSKSFILAFGDKDNSCLCLGELRTELANELSSKNLLNRCKPGMKPAWITEPPLFPGRAPGRFSLAAPHEDDPRDTEDDILKARAQGFSLVMNNEVFAEGFIPNNNAESLQKQLSLMSMNSELANNILQAVQSGCPPCVFVSVDIDKLVALACNVSEWEVVALPKSKDGTDPLSVEGIQNPQPIKKRDANASQWGGKMPRLH